MGPEGPPTRALPQGHFHNNLLQEL
ncbi:hypothetical protein [Lysobacter enzymogenes]